VIQQPSITIGRLVIERNFYRPKNLLLLLILTANGFLPGGKGTTIRHYTQITHITQNNTTIKRNTTHKITYTVNSLHRMNTTITTTII
jgi:hypothetical protein